jgi:hypothetical protein
MSADLNAHFLVVPDLAVVPTPSRLPRPGCFARRGSGCPGAGDAAARIIWRVNMRILCRREALECASDVEGRRRRPRTAATVRERLPWPGRAWTSCDNPTLCALRAGSQNKVLSCWEIAVAGCSDHALSGELSLITLYGIHRMEMISTLTDMTNPYVRFSRTHD